MIQLRLMPLIGDQFSFDILVEKACACSEVTIVRLLKGFAKMEPILFIGKLHHNLSIIPKLPYVAY